jgi:glycerol uptake facilitator-like aquaporin
MPSLEQNLLAEFFGTMFLVAVAIASVILPMDVLGAGVALSVFIGAVSVTFALFALIETFSSISGSNFNPAVTMALLISKETSRKKAVYYIGAQFAGGFIGLLIAHLMFFDTTSTLLVISDRVKTPATFFAEFVGTFILVGVIYGCVRGGSKHTGLAVACVVGGMFLATSSTMFANPAVTFCRVFTYAICGIAPESAVFFGVAEILGALFAALVFGYIFPSKMKDKCDPYSCPPKEPITIK